MCITLALKTERYKHHGKGVTVSKAFVIPVILPDEIIHWQPYCEKGQFGSGDSARFEFYRDSDIIVRNKRV